MRHDALGIFWQDEPPVKPEPKQVIKRTPPEPFWLEDSYLPNLDVALAFQPHLMTDEELVQCAVGRLELVYDVESYFDYFLVAFVCPATGKGIEFELHDDETLNGAALAKLVWIMQNIPLIDFNGRNYDVPMITAACSGRMSPPMLKEVSTTIIINMLRPRDVAAKYRLSELKVNHVDLIEVAPLSASLKIYGGRLHTKRMQDLPFHYEARLSMLQRKIVRWYCFNDLQQTVELREALREQVDLREVMGREYSMDLRSHSDAQVAEHVISHGIKGGRRGRLSKNEVAVGTRYRYNPPSFLKYKTDRMNWVLSVASNADYVVGPDGAVAMPPDLKSLAIEIAGGVYRMGIGGLHSSEKQAAHVADDEYMLVDRDMTSFYPRIILLLRLFPKHLGEVFLVVYQRIVERRLTAKRSGQKAIADSLKIAINGCFGKLGNKYSVLYSPDLLTQVTITGQLTLLMLIELLELNDFPVLSANTDGIVIKCKRTRYNEMDLLIKQWERDTGFETEEAQYAAVYSRDVNNYIAVKADGTTKNKGAYNNPWADKKPSLFRLHKNPTNTICVEAVEKFLVQGVPVGDTIRMSTDIRKFVTVRHVNGGAVKDKEYLGKAVRWYYATGVEGEIVYAKSGNKVPRSDGAKPCMVLPSEFPDDIDFDWYEREARSLLVDIGRLPAEALEAADGDRATEDEGESS